MPGDWIKIEKCTPRKTEVMAIAGSMGIPMDQAFGMCFRFWAWCDDNLATGNAPNVTEALLDDLIGRAGFSNALIKSGWLRVRNGSLEVPNFDRHLSQSAKNRGLTAQRAAKCKAKKSNDASVTLPLPELELEKSLASSTRNTGDPCTVEEAWVYAQSIGLGVTREGVELWHAKKSDAGWVMHRQNGVVQPIGNWQANLRGSVAWIREDLAKAQAAELRTKPFSGGKPPSTPPPPVNPNKWKIETP